MNAVLCRCASARGSFKVWFGRGTAQLGWDQVRIWKGLFISNFGGFERQYWIEIGIWIFLSESSQLMCFLWFGRAYEVTRERELHLTTIYLYDVTRPYSRRHRWRMFEDKKGEKKRRSLHAHVGPERDGRMWFRLFCWGERETGEGNDVIFLGVVRIAKTTIGCLALCFRNMRDSWD